jgi:hypothetical protein
MPTLNFNGLKTVTTPLADGDVALVIRANGDVEAQILHASDDGREISTDYDRLRMIYALMLLAANEDLMTTAQAQVSDQMAEALKLRVVN